jgi:hypothetical protein
MSVLAEELAVVIGSLSDTALGIGRRSATLTGADPAAEGAPAAE